MKYEFSAICISETSQKFNENFKVNVSIDGFAEPIVTGTLTSKGGVAIYIKDTFETFERVDLKSNEEECEAVWIEIRNKKSKNIIIGCIYRLPHSECC